MFSQCFYKVNILQTSLATIYIQSNEGQCWLFFSVWEDEDMHLWIIAHKQTHAWPRSRPGYRNGDREARSPGSQWANNSHSAVLSHSRGPWGQGARDSGGVSTPTLQLGHLVPWFDKQLQQKEPLDLSDPCLFPYGPALSHSNPQLLPPPCPRETHCETVPPHWCFKTRGLVHPHTPHLPATCSYCVHWIE